MFNRSLKHHGIFLRALKFAQSAVLIFSLSSCSVVPQYSGFLWRVSPPESYDEKATMHIWGVAHSTKLSTYQISEQVSQAFARADVYVLETSLPIGEHAINFSRSPDPAAFLPKGVTIFDVIDAPTGARLREHLAKLEAGGFQVSKTNFLKTKPELLRNALLMTNPIAKTGLQAFLKKLEEDSKAQLPPERYLLDKAAKSGKRISQLEMSGESVGAWEKNCGSVENRSIMIQDALLNSEKESHANPIGELMDLVAKGDFEKFEAAYFELTKSNIAEKLEVECSIEPRTVNWIPLISDLSAKPQSSFLVVGAGHLIGRRGLVSLLRQQGFRVDLIRQL